MIYAAHSRHLNPRVGGSTYNHLLSTESRPIVDPIQSVAPYAILIDAKSGVVLFEKNADDLMRPSSMAKLMTAELAFKSVR